MTQPSVEVPERTFEVLTFGETMLRLSAPHFGRLEETVSLDVRIGGSESNTAVALARLGVRVAWFSRLPDNPLGRRIENEIRRWGVDTNRMIWDDTPDARAGLYFLDFGVPPRSIDVYYDRRDAAITHVALDEIDFDAVKHARLLHLSGITPALSSQCADAVAALVSAARAAETPISFDVNYRAKLWTPAQAKATLETILPEVAVLLCPQSDAELIFGIAGDGVTIAKEMRARYGVEAAIITCGGDGAVACDERGDCAAKPFVLGQIVDRVGAGDAFNAGVLWGWLQDDLELGLRYGTAMAALKHTMPGDLLLSTRAEIERAVGGGSGGIRR
jgi:2-dehydro-3-deoxygluconokinase